MPPFDLSIPAQLTAALGPDLLLMVGAMLLLLWAAWRPDGAAHERHVGWASLVLTLLTAAAVVWYMVRGFSASNGIVAVDNFRWVSDLIFLLGALGTIALAMDYNAREGILAAEAHVLVLLATSGMMLLAAARDLIIVFLGIEVMSVAVYVLAGMNRRSEKSAEGALKYFLLGAFSTAFLLYGIALVYGATGTTNLSLIGTRIIQFSLFASPLLLTGVAMLLIGFGFKVAAVPFHMWAPDVYEGAPTPITAYMAAAVKAGAFAAFLRVWIEAFPSIAGQWASAIFWLAVLTMVGGNVIALAQKNVKRMLAYSSIAHAGYILVALASGSDLGTSAFLFYLFAYTLANFGAFGVVVAIGYTGEPNVDIDDFAGLWNVRPGLAVAMTIFMLALLGFPIFGGMGFLGKWYILQAALAAQHPLTALVVILVITSVISAGYYLQVVRVMFMRPRPAEAPAAPPVGWLTGTVIAVSAVLLIALGILPDGVVRWTRGAIPARVGTATAIYSSAPTR